MDGKKFRFILLVFGILYIILSPYSISQTDNGSDHSIEFSKPPGFYDSPIIVFLSSELNGTTIYYTTDGSEPNQNSNQYSSPLTILKTTVIRAVSYRSGLCDSNLTTNTYFIKEKSTFPVISISTDPGNFFNPDTGIYMMGKNPGTEIPYFDANFWQDWERPIHIEFFETDGQRVLDMNAGAKIFGAWSRANAQKSLAIFARKTYGKGNIDYKLFPDLTLDKFESIVLRNSGNDWSYTMFRDGLMQSLMKGTNVDVQEYRPAVIFINGEYWGIQNIREKINEHFLASHSDANPDSIDLLELNDLVIQGSNTTYKSLLNFLGNADMSLKTSYDYIKLRMDVSNFIDYEIAEIYFDNTDWPGNNIKFWRPQRKDGKWRWILFDTDFGFGLFDVNGYKHNTLDFATTANGQGYANQPWATFLLRKLLVNNNFKNEFINRFADLCNTNFNQDVVLKKINEFTTRLEPEIQKHLTRWNFSYSGWQREVERLKTFAKLRQAFLKKYFKEKFGLSGMYYLRFNKPEFEGGSIQVNSLKISDFPWTGFYFKDVPLKIKAVSKPGFRFEGWKGDSQFTSPIITIDNPTDFNVTPIFEPDSSTLNNIVINEINYNSSPDFDCEDWVELYNNSDHMVNLSGWVFKDGNDEHKFNLPDKNLNSNEYLVLCRDTSKFSALFPDVKNIAGNFDFGLNNGGELVRLFDNSMNIVDSLTFDDELPWVVEPDGTGATLSLKNPDLDNSIPENWFASSGHGTPGKVNDVHTGIINSQDNKPAKFILNQNFPNPFNPFTTITYQLPKSDYVRLKVYDLLGQEIKTLVDDFQNAGNYRVIFDGANLSSGIYYYKLTTSSVNLVRKMSLLK